MPFSLIHLNPSEYTHLEIHPRIGDDREAPRRGEGVLRAGDGGEAQVAPGALRERGRRLYATREGGGGALRWVQTQATVPSYCPSNRATLCPTSDGWPFIKEKGT